MNGRLRVWLAAGVGVVVFGVTVWARIAVGAGVYYDDGVYLALARSLSEGTGYLYANLPGAVPGVKYPPAYPASLALAETVLGSYPGNLGALKGLNALFMGIAASLAFLLFARGGSFRLWTTAAVTVFSFISVPTLSFSTALVSEPLFLALAGAALLWVQRVKPEAPAWWLVGLGALTAAAFLTRAIGLSLIVGVAVAVWLARPGIRKAAVFAVAAGLPTLGWLSFAAARADRVPEVARGQYGSYSMWFGDGLSTDAAGRLGGIVGAKLAPALETLQFLWIPRAPFAASTFVILLLIVAVLAGGISMWKRNPALPIFLATYLAIVSIWPYDPYRFFYTVMPFITLLAVQGIADGIPRMREDFPGWGLPIAGVATAILVVNTVQYQARGLARRAWSSTQTIPAEAYRPLHEWISANADADDVIASGLDPFTYWETGRKAVPSWDFRSEDFGAYDRAPTVLAEEFQRVLDTFGPAYVAVVLGENKQAAVVEAYADLRPEHIEEVFRSEGLPHVGVVYRLVSPPTPR